MLAAVGLREKSWRGEVLGKTKTHCEAVFPRCPEASPATFAGRLPPAKKLAAAGEISYTPCPAAGRSLSPRSAIVMRSIHRDSRFACDLNAPSPCLTPPRFLICSCAGALRLPNVVQTRCSAMPVAVEHGRCADDAFGLPAACESSSECEAKASWNPQDDRTQPYPSRILHYRAAASSRAFDFTPR